MEDFTGDAGTLYFKYSEGDDKPHEVWFEDFCLLGQGDSQIEALGDARICVAAMGRLITDAIEAALPLAAIKGAIQPNDEWRVRE